MRYFKIALLSIGLFFQVTSEGVAGLPLPGYVYELVDIAEAQDEARQWGQLIAVVWTDLDCGCRLAESATYDTFRELHDDMTIVYACSESDWKQLPSIVKQALRLTESGNYIPKTVIVDADMSKVIAIVPYIRDPEERVSRLEQTIIDSIANE